MQVECDCECCQQEFGIHNTITPCKCTNGYQCAGGEPILVVTDGVEYEFHLERTACELCPTCHLELPPKEVPNDS